MKKRLSIRSTEQLAQHLGLSRWTVSRALNGHEGVGRATRERVEAAVAKFGFQPDLYARGLRGGKTGMVGVSVPELENLHLVGKLSALQTALRTHNLRITLETHAGNPAVEEDIIAHFAAMRVEGVILISSKQSARGRGLSRLRAAGIPHVLIDPWHEEMAVAVYADRCRAMELMLGHLQDLGHDRVAVLGLDRTHAYGETRWRGIERNIRAGVRLELIAVEDAEWMDSQYGHELAGMLIRRRWKCGAIMALNDRIAMGAIRRLTDAGFSVPGDFAVAGYDNMEVTEFFRPSLTTIDARPERLIAAASDLLCRQLAGDAAGARPVWIEPQLIVRESTAAISNS